MRPIAWLGLLAAALPLTALAVDPLTFTVTTTADTGVGSLRSAIIGANAAAFPDHGANEIVFAIPGAGVHVIQPRTALPAITQRVDIDGYSQPGSSFNTRNDGGSNAVLTIALDGSLMNGAPRNGLRFEAASSGSRVRGLNIRDFADAGLEVDRVGIYVQGNFIGTDAGGTSAHGNRIGVRLNAVAGATIGGEVNVSVVPADVNVISGNRLDGVRADCESPGQQATSITIRNNIIGGNATGTGGLGNGADGVFEGDCVFNAVGAGGVISDNIIVANGGNGVSNLATGTLILDNLIGVGVGSLGANGPALGNVGDGVYVGGAATGVVLNDQRFTQGFAAGRASIAHNGGAGLYIDGQASVDVVAQGFDDNGGLGIDIAPTGVNGNDAGDIDTGPNERLNAPVLDSVSFDASSGFGDLVGHLDSNAGQGVSVVYRLSDACDGSGFGEGARPLSTDPWTTGTLDTDPAGHTEFTLHTPQLQPGTAVAVFTRHLAVGSSASVVSEFSNCLVVPGGDLIFTDGFDGG